MKLLDAGIMIFVFLAVVYTFVHMDKTTTKPTTSQITEALK